MYQHILQYCHRQIHRYLLLYPCSLRLRQVRVEISPHQQFGYLGVLSEHCNKSLYLRGVVEGKATYDDVPPPLPYCQLEADNVGDELLYLLHHVPRGRPVEHRHSATVLDRRVHSNNAAAVRPAGVYSIREIGFLEEAQALVGLGHPSQYQIKPSNPDVLYVIKYKPNRCPGFVPSLALLPPPHSCHHTTSHFLPMVAFYPRPPSYPSTHSCTHHPLLYSVSPAPSGLLQPDLIVVPFLSTTPTPVSFTLEWSTLQGPSTREIILIHRLPWLLTT